MVRRCRKGRRTGRTAREGLRLHGSERRRVLRPRPQPANRAALEEEMNTMQAKELDRREVEEEMNRMGIVSIPHPDGKLRGYDKNDDGSDS